MTQPPGAAGLEAGEIIAGRFRLERLLGKGGMGSVWVAHHLALNVEVALKFIDASVAKRGDVASRFEQEAQAAAKVKGSHVVNILDYGTDSCGRAYIAMELLQGEELSTRLDRIGNVPVADAYRVVVHACRGLGRAHAAGIVHRDLKPENLFLVDEDDGFVVKVLDFGIAKAHSPVGAVTPHTDTGQILGTPLYMSPEQALGTSEIDFRSDLYSLAVVAFRCLTGSVPFHSKALGELIVKVSTQPVPSARALRPELPPAVDAWFRRAMHKDPAQRFGSAREMAEQFGRACGLAPGAQAAPASAPGSARAPASTPPPPAAAPPSDGTPLPAAASAPTVVTPPPPPSASAPAGGTPVPASASGPAGGTPLPASTWTPARVAPPPPSTAAPAEVTPVPPAASASGASNVTRAAETLMDATATYSPPTTRPWLSIAAAAGLMVFLVGSIVVLATGPFGPSGPLGSRPARDRLSTDALNAAALSASSPSAPPAAPSASTPTRDGRPGAPRDNAASAAPSARKRGVARPPAGPGRAPKAVPEWPGPRATGSAPEWPGPRATGSAPESQAPPPAPDPAEPPSFSTPVDRLLGDD